MFKETGDIATVLRNYHLDGTVPDLWFDWFCSDSELSNRARELMPVLAYFINHKSIDVNGKYVFFKNCAPVFGDTYDAIKICDKESGDVLYQVDNRLGDWYYSSADEGFEKDTELPI